MRALVAALLLAAPAATAQALFPGIDAGATLLFGKLVVSARVSALPPLVGSVPGVTGLRFTTGIAVQPDLLNLSGVAFR